MSPSIVALHLGALHPYEKAVTLLLAFGPFVLLGIVVVVRRRHDVAEERAEVERATTERATGAQDAQAGVVPEEQQELSERATPGRPGSPS